MNATQRREVKINSRVDNTGNRIQTTSEDKSISTTRMVIMVMLIKGLSDLLMGNKAGWMETGLKGQECHVGATK